MSSEQKTRVLSPFEYAINEHIHNNIKPVEDFNSMRPQTDEEVIEARRQKLRSTLSRILTK